MKERGEWKRVERETHDKKIKRQRGRGKQTKNQNEQNHTQNLCRKRQESGEWKRQEIGRERRVEESEEGENQDKKIKDIEVEENRRKSKTNKITHKIFVGRERRVKSRRDRRVEERGD